MVLNYRENRENKIVRLHTLNFNGVQNNFNNLHNPILFAKSFPVYRDREANYNLPVSKLCFHL